MQTGPVGVAEGVASGTDGLVCLLRVLHLRHVDAGLCGKILLAEEFRHLGAGRRHGGGCQRHRIGTHVGDETLFVEFLRHGHRALRGEAQLAPGFLLQRGGAEWLVGAPRVGLRLDGGHRELGCLQCFAEPLG